MVYIHNFKAQGFLKHIRCPYCTCHMSHLFFSYSLPSGTCQCCSWGQTEWESDGRNQHWFPHWLCLFLFIPLGTLRFVCFVFFSSHFLPRNFAAACKGGNPALLGKGELRGSLKMLKTLHIPECLLKKSQITKLSVGCAKGFGPCRYKIPSHSPFQSSSPVPNAQTLPLQGRNWH